MFNVTRTAALLAGLLIASATFAQPAPDYGDGPDSGPAASVDAPDPPSRVARLSLINGAVSFVPAGEGDWVEAQLNRPLIAGDKLWTDRGARAELQIGESVIRVDEQSSFNFLNLDDQTAQVELTQGTLNLRVRRLDGNQTYEIDTPTLAFVINRVGEYRIDVAPDGHGTIVTAFHGGGDAYGEAGARFRIEEGQSVRFNDAQLQDYTSNNVPNADDFDRFCFDRDARWDNSPSRRYVSEDVIGYADLDNNGSWSDEADYGNVWYPSTVAVGWTPYSYGHWGWVGAYGWTWIDSAPWGFAPFHYGRWAYIHNRWGWCPGQLHVRSYYAPALVAFIGGGGLRVGFSTGAPVGWFPLGPRDVYVPGYRVSRDYFTRININNTRITNVTINNFYGNYSRGNFDYSRVNYANRNIAGAVTAVPGNVFVGARPIRGSALAVNRETFANARVSGFAAIAPTRASLAFNGGKQAPAPPRTIANRNIIAATRPPAPVASFAQRESQLQRDPGRALPVNRLRVGPSVPGNGQQAQRADRTARPNLNVVTTNGRPANSPAPAIMPRNTVNQPQVENGRGPAQRGNPQQQGNKGVAESPAVATPPGGRPPASMQERGPATRYTNPNAQDQNARDNGRATLNNQRSATPGSAVQDANANRNVQRGNEAQQREQQAAAKQQQLQRGQQQDQERQQQLQQQQEKQAQERVGRQQQLDQQRTQQQQTQQRGQAQQQQERAQQQNLERQQQLQQQRAQEEQQAQERAGRQQQLDQQRAQQQQAQQREQAQQQQRARQEQQAQESAARQQQVDQQRAQQQQAQQREQAQQQQMQERQAQQQMQQQRAQQQQQAQERAAQQQRAQPQQQQQQKQQQQQQGQRARGRDDNKDKDNKDNGGHR